MKRNIKINKLFILTGVVLLFGNAFYFFEFLVQVAPSAMTAQLMNSFSLDATGVGFLTGSFFWSYTVLQMPGGFLVDRCGARFMLTIAALICSTGTLMFGYTSVYFIAVLGRVFMGVGGAFAFTGALYLILRWVPEKYVALTIGLLQSIGCIGAIAGGSLLSISLSYYSWRAVLLILAFIGFIIAVSTYVFVKNSPSQDAVKSIKKNTLLKSMRDVLFKKQTWIMAAYAFAIWTPITAFAGLWGIPFFQTSRHTSLISAADAIAFVWLGVAVGSPLLGWISEKLGRRCIPLAFSGLVGCASSLIIIFYPYEPMTILYVLLFAFGVGASGQTLIFAVVKDNNKLNNTGFANGFNNMIILISPLIFQPLIGAILDSLWNGEIINHIKIYSTNNYQVALLIIPVCYFAAAIIGYFFVQETYCKNITAFACPEQI